MPAGFIRDKDTDLTIHAKGHPLGERMVVTGRIVDADGKPVRHSLVEIWQANASGRYHHPVDTHDAPLDPNFHGMGRMLTDDDGRYRFSTVKPGAYPWQNHPFAWRPAHIHFSLLGNAPIQRLITQMYFPGDPLLALDPVFNSVPDEERASAWSAGSTSRPESRALGYRYDIALAGARPRRSGCDDEENALRPSDLFPRVAALGGVRARAIRRGRRGDRGHGKLRRHGRAPGDSLDRNLAASPSGVPPTVPKGAAIPHGYGRIETAHDGSFRIERYYASAAAATRRTSRSRCSRAGCCARARASTWPIGARVRRSDPQALAGSERVKIIASRDAAPAAARPSFTGISALQGDGETVFFAF